MKHKTLGIVGGLGTETSCTFCLKINNELRRITNVQPHILLDNLPVSVKAEEKIINGKASKEHLNLLKESVKRLNKLNVNFIVIPCNTIHVFMEKLRKISKAPILSIIEETARECKRLNVKKAGLIASTKTIKEKLYFKELKKYNIELILPNKVDQRFISSCILRIINNKTRSKDKLRLLQIIKKIEENSGESVILGCTDLPLLISQKDTSSRIIDSCKILEESTVSILKQNINF